MSFRGGRGHGIGGPVLPDLVGATIRLALELVTLPNCSFIAPHAVKLLTEAVMAADTIAIGPGSLDGGAQSGAE